MYKKTPNIYQIISDFCGNILYSNIDNSSSCFYCQTNNIFDFLPPKLFNPKISFNNQLVKTNQDYFISLSLTSINDFYFLSFSQVDINKLSIDNYMNLFLKETTDFIYLKKIVDKKHIFVLTSDSMAKLCGYDSKEEMEGLDDFDVFSPEYATKYYQDEIDILNNKLTTSFLQEYIKLDGKIGWVNTKKSLVYDIQGKPIGIFGISRDITELKLAQDRLNDAISHDFLTNAKSRRAFDEDINILLNESKRFHFSFSIIHFDIDNFKNINDTLGHQSGDKVLIDFSSFTMNFIREIDRFYRIGGDEFILLLSHTDKNGLDSFLKRFQKKLLNHTKEIPYTLSIGATVNTQNDTWFSLYKRCDEALYKSKNEGKNRFYIK